MRNNEKQKLAVKMANKARFESQRAMQLRTLDAEFIIPNILKFNECLFENTAMPIELMSLRINKSHWSSRARERFDEFFTVIRRAGRTNALYPNKLGKMERRRFSSRIGMTIYNKIAAIELLKAHGYENQAKWIEKYNETFIDVTANSKLLERDD